MRRIASLCVFTLLVSAPIVQAQYDQYGRWDYHEGFEPANLVYERGYTPELAASLVERWNAIGEVSDGADWIGDFFRPYGMLGTTILRIGKNGDYVRISTHSCQPDVRRFDFGHAVSTADGVRLEPQTPGAAPATFVKVSWGDRRYLVHEDEMADFCRFASGRIVFSGPEELEDTGYFRSEGEESGDVSGSPSVPSRFASLVEPPLETRLIRITPRRSDRYTLLFDLGATDGVRKKMILVRPSDDRWGLLEIVRVGSHWCEATLELDGRDDENAPDAASRLPEIGAVFTTCIACR